MLLSPRSNLSHPMCWKRTIRKCAHGVLIYRPGDIANGKVIQTPSMDIGGIANIRVEGHSLQYLCTRIGVDVPVP